MTMNTALSAEWLALVLASLGSTSDEVARTLQKAGATGVRADIWNDPVADYIRAQAGSLLPPDAYVKVAVTADEIVVSTDPDDEQEITASMPGPVEDFLDRFDAEEAYQDLARQPAS